MAYFVKTALLILSLLAAAPALGQGDMTRQMLAETNLARTVPRRYAGYLRDMRGQYLGTNYWIPGTTAMMMTSEGVAGLNEAIRFLEKQAPLPPLAWSPGLARAAADLVRDQSQTGQIGHAGSRSGDTRQRIERHGTWLSRIGENVGYGPDTARFMVIQLIIDDGVADRGHRHNIFTPGFKVAGAACGPHPEFKHMCVMDFAVGFRGKGN